VRVFSRSTIVRFSRSHPSAREPLRAWFAEVTRAQWSGPADIRRAYASASLLAGDRVVFNIKGNTYRVVVMVKYEFHAVYVRFIGTHAEYDRIDATTI
jgi:mRNA interferase HigB